MLRRKPVKKKGFAKLGAISMLGKNVAGNLDKTIQRELDEQANMQLQGKHYISRLRMQGRHVLHTKVILLIVVVLCMVDCVLVIGELILDMHAIKAMGDNKHGSGEKTECRQEVEYDYDYDTGVGEPIVTNATPHKQHHVHTLEEKIAHGFHYASISILIMLVVETTIKIFCFGSHFIKKKFEVFDSFVVFLSLVLDLIFIEGTTSRSIQESAYILSFLLPWRVIRVVNSMIVALFDHEHIKLLLMFKSKKYLSKQIDELSDDLLVLQKQLSAIKSLSAEYSVPDWRINQVFGQIFSENSKKKHALSALVTMSVGMAVNSQKSIWTSKVMSQPNDQTSCIAVPELRNDPNKLNNGHIKNGDAKVVIEMITENDEACSANSVEQRHDGGDLYNESDTSDTDEPFCDAISRFSVDEGASLIAIHSTATTDELF